MENERLVMAEGAFKKVIAIRLKPGADVLESILEALNEAGIKNGVIVSGIGSLAKARYCNAEEIPESPAGYGYGDPLEDEGAIEVTSLNGIVCHDPSGEANMHIHITMSDVEGNGYGGHLIEGSIVLLTMDIVIAEIGDGIQMVRDMDPDLGVPINKPTQE